jgi:exodeoxyribonuclease III
MPRRWRPRSPSDFRNDRQLTVTTLNVGAAAPVRAQALLSWLRRRGSDVLVLSETSSGPGTDLLAAGLRDSGYQVVGACDLRDRGVLIAARGAVLERSVVSAAVTLPSRAVCVELGGSTPLNIMGVYVPSRDRSPAKIKRKREFIRSLLSCLESMKPEVRDSLLIVGDFNVVPRHHDPPLRGYFQFEYEFFDSLQNLGFALAHELRPSASFPHSWIGRTGTGYLYDYIFVGGALRDTITKCQYLHGPRETRLTDHAAVTVLCELERAGSVASYTRVS